MKKGDRVALGCFCVLVFSGVIAAVLYLTGWGTILKNTVMLAKRGQDMTAYSQRYPFAPQQGAGISEPRLLAYLEVCCRAKPSGDKIDAWEENYRLKHKGHKTGFRGQAAGFVSAFMHEIEAALAEQQMSPTEFAWIGDRVRALSAPSSSPGEMAQTDWELITRHAEKIRACALGDKAYGIVAGFANVRRGTPKAEEESASREH